MSSSQKNQPFFHRASFAWHGIQYAFGSEASFRFQSLAAAGVLVLLCVSWPAPIWWAVLLLPVAGVLSLELMNTALEKLVDRLHPEKHADIKVAKDCAAGAVLVFSLFSVVVLLAFVVELFGKYRVHG